MWGIVRFLLLVAVVIIPTCGKGQAMKYDQIEYIASGILDMPQVLKIDSNGRTRYQSHTNESDPDWPEIGLYETVLTTSQVESLQKAFDNLSFGTLADHWGQVGSGEDYRRIRVTIENRTTEKLIATRLPLDPGMQNLLTTLDKVIAQVRSSPRQTLRLELGTPSISADGQLVLTISLKNRGTEQVTLRNPIGAKADGDGRFMLQTWPDKEPSELRTDDLLAIVINKVEFTNVADAIAEGLAPAARTFDLMPGKSLNFEIRGVSPFEIPGNYVLRGSYANFSTEVDGRAVLRGEVFSRKIVMSSP